MFGIVQNDGNLVLYDSGNGAKWSSGTSNGQTYSDDSFTTQPTANFFKCGGTCSQCQAGTYKTYGDASACISCASDSWSPAGSMTGTSCACNAGYTVVAGRGDDSCQYANDNQCDEARYGDCKDYSLCPEGTDKTDCSSKCALPCTAPTFSTKTIVQSTPVSGQPNLITVTLTANYELTAGSSVTIMELTGSATETTTGLPVTTCSVGQEMIHDQA